MIEISSHHISDLPGDPGARVFQHQWTYVRCVDELNCGLTPADSLVVYDLIDANGRVTH